MTSTLTGKFFCYYTLIFFKNEKGEGVYQTVCLRVRLRKKTWKNPGTVFLDYHVYEEDISISSNWEVFLEVLNGNAHSADSFKEVTMGMAQTCFCTLGHLN